MHIFTITTDQNMILSPSKYLKFIVANTQQVSTQEKLCAENINILMKERTCFMRKVIWFKQQETKWHISQKGQIERGRAGRTTAGSNFLEIVCTGTYCQQLSGAGAARFKQRVWSLRGTRLLPSRNFISIFWVREAGKCQ